MANHSCDPNAITFADGPRQTMISTRTIAKDDEITIAYIDTSNPFSYRQAELQRNYDFTCACNKCRKGPTLREDLFLRSAAETPVSDEPTDMMHIMDQRYAQDPRYYIGPAPGERRLAAIQGMAFTLWEESQRSIDPTLALRKAQEGLDLCRKTGIWPIHRQPYPHLKHQKNLKLFQLGNIDLAWRGAIYRHFELDPILIPAEHHPTRIVNTWSLIQWTNHYYNQQDSPHLHDILSTGFSFEKVLWHLLHQVARLAKATLGNGRITAAVQNKLVDMRDGIEEVAPGYTQHLGEGIQEQIRMFRAFDEDAKW